MISSESISNNSRYYGKTCAVIPFYNEENTVGETIARVRKFVDFVIAVNDGSTDDSPNKIINSEDIIVLNHNVNLGKGKALFTGLTKSIELNTKLTLTLDADLQHDPDFIPRFIESADNFDIVIGNRLHNVSGMPVHRRASNFLTSYLLSRKLGIKIIDSQCGYRIFRTEILKELLPENPGFEAESEMIVNAGRKKLNIGFTDIPVIYGNDNSKMNSLEAVKGFIKILFM